MWLLEWCVTPENITNFDYCEELQQDFDWGATVSLKIVYFHFVATFQARINRKMLDLNDALPQNPIHWKWKN